VICDAEVDDIRRKYFNSDGLPGMFFYGLKVYFDTPNQNVAQYDPLTVEWVEKQHKVDKIKSVSKYVRFYGGTIAEKDDPAITHIIMDEDQSSDAIANATRRFSLYV
jgi:DNA ligase-4